MKFILATTAIVALTLVLTSSVQSAQSDVDQLYLELSTLTNATSHLALSIKKFIGGDKITDKAIVEKFKDQGNLLATAETELTDQMSLLGEFLGIIQRAPPGPNAPIAPGPF